ncbi:AAA family ATPase [Methanocaldococcus sp.]
MVREKIEYILNKLYEGMYEREEAIKLSLLSAISGESIFLLGPPGVAKSLIARRMKHVFKDAKNFEYLMGRFSTPDEIFGPISISKLKNEDKYERIIDGYLPDSEIVFLDEIWKASPAIQNTLLTAINEKIFRNGSKEIKIPLKLLIAASNELPAEGEGLEALWDRFIIRLYVDGIKDKSNFEKMITDTKDPYEDNIPTEYKITEDEYNKWREEIKKIEVPPEVLNIINVIRKKIVIRNQQNPEKPPIYISDRRWKKIVNILKTSAYLNGRKKIDIMDCFLISHTIWSRYEEIEEVRDLVEDVIAKYGYKVGIDTDKVKSRIEKLRKDIENNIQREVVIEKKIPKKYSFKIEDIYDDSMTKKFLKLKERVKNPKSGYFAEYILKEDFENLKIGEEQELILYRPYDSEYVKSAGEFLVKKEDDVTLTIIPISSRKVYSEPVKTEIEYSIKKEKRIEGKLPSKQDIKRWDKEIGEINSELDDMILKISEYKKRDLSSAKNNLFVDPSLTTIAFRSLDESQYTIAKLKIELEMLRDLYEPKE